MMMILVVQVVRMMKRVARGTMITPACVLATADVAVVARVSGDGAAVAGMTAGMTAALASAVTSTMAAAVTTMPSTRVSDDSGTGQKH